MTSYDVEESRKTSPTTTSPSDLYSLTRWVDRLIEEVTRDRMSLDRALGKLLPQVATRIGASAITLRTFDETLELHSFSFPAGSENAPSTAKALASRTESGIVEANGLVVCQLDVAGEWFGTACAIAAHEGAERDLPALRDRLEAVCEELDNYLHAIKSAREKQKITQALVRALQHRVLSQGLQDAVKILGEHVRFSRLVVAIGAEDLDGAPVHALVIDGDTCALDTLGGSTRAGGIQDEARRYLAKGDPAFLLRFGFSGAQEEVLIHGVKETTLVGKISIEAKDGSFDTHDRDLVASFGSFVCQRVVDFNKEYRTLARSFCGSDVDRMLRASDYVDRYLTPRDREVAMLYVDISGFTRISEQILVDPAQIGKLVDVWGAEAVRLVHAFGGVFDKMVGDCVIGLFGPPFYEDSESDRLRRAIEAAVAIRTMTNKLPNVAGFEVLRHEGLAVSTGVNLAPLFVGLFGPNENFTGFSSGMNNTSRLQGLAGRDEIVVMETALARLDGEHTFQFGELREGKAKNVAEPLKFRPLVPRPEAS